MVKGISRQVIVVESPDQKLFEQAIYILKDGQKELSDEVLLREARKITQTKQEGSRGSLVLYILIGVLIGAALTGIAWVLSALFL